MAAPRCSQSTTRREAAHAHGDRVGASGHRTRRGGVRRAPVVGGDPGAPGLAAQELQQSNPFLVWVPAFTLFGVLIALRVLGWGEVRLPSWLRNPYGAAFEAYAARVPGFI